MNLLASIKPRQYCERLEGHWISQHRSMGRCKGLNYRSENYWIRLVAEMFCRNQLCFCDDLIGYF